MPPLGFFGLNKNIRVFDLKGLDDVNYRYDSATHKMRLFSGGVEIVSGALAARTLTGFVIGE